MRVVSQVCACGHWAHRLLLAASCAAFDFWRYLTESMEDDFSNIVGVNLEMVS